MMTLLDKFKGLIDEISSKELNQDQKDLAIRILEKFEDKDLEYVFQFIAQRIKTGFRFDSAPESNSQTIALLEKDDNLSFVLDENKTKENTLIIGENYDALKNLLLIERERERAGAPAKYDLIYIDPPYNTEATKNDGNSIANDKENVQAAKFVYRDKYSRNGWLNLMNERLKLAKELLKDDGVIFVSIDDAEQAYLKVLMDEIFGEENFVNNFMWMHGLGKKDKFSRTLQEYILCYCKNKNFLRSWRYDKIIEYDNLSNPDNDSRGEWFSGSISFSEERSNKNHPNYFTIYSPSGISWTRQWQCNEEEMKELLKNNLIYFGTPPEYNNVPRYKKFNGEAIEIIPTNFFDNHGTTKSAKTELYKIIKKPSDIKKEHTPKPILLIKDIAKLISGEKIRILDFFAGTGTTGHAVLELNKEDGGNRTFTLVTNNENNIGIDVNYERLYRINHGIGSKGETFEWTNKNEPYKSNLNVYNIKYYDISLFNNIDVKEIVKELIKLLKDFGVNSLSEESEKDYTNLLNSLLSLKPQLKENNESN
ncbi:hypothetical protein AAW50_03590 [Mycoplasmopsis canis]|nr:hypothetical protein AAW50_03590 [Mycoplasmopsis canis]